MPIYDLKCDSCGITRLDVYEPVNTPNHQCVCGGVFERAWFMHPPSVIGDECDITVNHGICNLDGTPRRYRSRAEMQRVMKERGLISRVEHVGRQGGDRSAHTVRWI